MVVGLSKTRVVLLAALLQGALAANTPYGQCGGLGYTGDKTCPDGYACQVQNDYYHQCLPGTAATTSSTTKPTTTPTTTQTSQTTSKPTSTLATATPTTGGVKCTGTFTPVSASAYVASLHPGWNLGNTLDAIQNEGDWNNPPVVPSTFDDIKAAGFKSIRLPVTWAYHFTTQSPSWTVNATFLQRVSDVIDQIAARNFPVIVNAHHDSFTWADISAPGANLTAIEERLYRLWYQVGTKLACKSSLVAFEPINEIPGTTAEHGAEVNKLNGIFLQAISDAGGFNAQRVVTLVGAGEDSIKTSLWFKRPDARFKNPWALQYHYYSPYDFIFSAWGKTTWGSDADKAALDADFASIRANFTDIPLVLGEWDASSTNTETAGRWRYFDFLLRTAAKYNIATIMWDNGLDHFDRAARKWRDPTALAILLNAAKGTVNALPDSTTDVAATSQFSSAYVYHRAGEAVGDAVVPYLFNGLTLTSITNSKTAKALTRGSDYSVSGSNITLTSAFLKTVITSSSTTGSLANLTLAFSAGAPTNLDITQYATPKLGATSSVLPATSADLYIPVAWAGQRRPAAVRALKADGGILIDDWTQWLGPLQAGRLTYAGQWDWDGGNVILRAAVLDAVRTAAQTTTFTVEFYPRVPGNAANYTITV
ncbi:endoglucanase D precursor [Byssothecium circinans]|uniref:Endoglucanase D n=1 Tax=Byssothecium circinans TaxID=147558 RepID=A0A6A5U2L1_9PLEO|nr:endoglucanase D precursor [Byssothecium circinans]